MVKPLFHQVDLLSSDTAMPIDSGAPAEVDGTQAGSQLPQILVQSIAEDD